jgi:hypothetical protein
MNQSMNELKAPTTILTEFEHEIKQSLLVENDFKIASQRVIKRLENEKQFLSQTTNILDELATMKLKYDEEITKLTKKLHDYQTHYQQRLEEHELVKRENQQLRQQLSLLRNDKCRQRIAQYKKQQEKLAIKILMRWKLLKLLSGLTVSSFLLTVVLFSLFATLY